MKKQIALFVITFFVSISGLLAQGGGMQRQTPEERIKANMEAIKPLGLNEDQTKKTTEVVTDLVNNQQKLMEDFRNNGGGDRDVWMAKRKELEDARDTKLKEIFNADQYKKWIDEIVPSMRPQRRN
ncbi:MAG: hypothetical protein WD135_03765 [Ferruginibacter sp.]